MQFIRTCLFTMAASVALLAQGTGKAVLFDDTHYEFGGSSAEWTICTGHEPDPIPASPAKETDWAGGLSSLGFDLYLQGYKVQTLPKSGGRITYGDTTNAQDLSRYNVFFIPECYTYFSGPEKTAIMNFVKNGGGLFLLGNHNGATRMSSSVSGSTDAFHVFNDLMTNNGVANNAFGFTWVAGHAGDSYSNTTSTAYTAVVNPITTAIIRGSNGFLSMQDFHSYSYINVNTANNANAFGILATQVSGDPSTNYFIAACIWNGGRVVATGDSSPADDGTTTSSGKNLYDSYNINSNRAFFLNAIAWLAGGSSTPNTVTATITAPSTNTTVASGTALSFTGSATDSSSSATLSYRWNFGDGSTATGASTTHAFSNTGSSNVSYTVTFTATDNTGVSASATRIITVTPQTITTYTITASAGTGGSISPSGSVAVASGSSKTFTITANSGYAVSAVTVDGTSKGAITTYTFSNLTANHTINATFVTSTGSTIAENFDTGTKTAYATGNVTFASGVWTLNDALLGNTSSDPHNGTQSVRVRNSGKVTMLFNWAKGAKTVSVKHASYGSDASTTWSMWYSTNSGSTWTQAGSTVTTVSTTLQTATFTVNVQGSIRFEIRKTDGSTRRVNFDDFQITGY